MLCVQLSSVPNVEPGSGVWHDRGIKVTHHFQVPGPDDQEPPTPLQTHIAVLKRPF
jgi:hypothetical protein